MKKFEFMPSPHLFNCNNRKIVKNFNVKAMILLLNLFLVSNYCFAQSDVTKSNSNSQIKKVELRHITLDEYNVMNIDISKLKKDEKEPHEYYIDKEGNVFFILKDEEKLIYYTTGRIYTDRDIINNVSIKTYYMLHNNASTIKNRIENVSVNMDSKTIIR